MIGFQSTHWNLLFHWLLLEYRLRYRLDILMVKNNKQQQHVVVVVNNKIHVIIRRIFIPVYCWIESKNESIDSIDPKNPISVSFININ